MNDLETAIGRKRVLELSRIVGGRTVRIPTMFERPDAIAARERFVALVGVEIAADLISQFAGQRLYVPKGPHVEHYSRTRAIPVESVMTLTDEGMTADAIAQELNCSTRTVYSKRSQHRERQAHE